MADELDALLARVREQTEEDRAAAEQVVARLRTARSRSRTRTWASTLLAGAAMLGGLTYVAQNQVGLARDLPIRAAYDAYTQASGDGW